MTFKILGSWKTYAALLALERPSVTLLMPAGRAYEKSTATKSDWTYRRSHWREKTFCMTCLLAGDHKYIWPRGPRFPLENFWTTVFSWDTIWTWCWPFYGTVDIRPQTFKSLARLENSRPRSIMELSLIQYMREWLNIVSESNSRQFPSNLQNLSRWEENRVTHSTWENHTIF
jgi:hypothetical protein